MNKKLIGGLAVVLLLGAAAGYAWWNRPRGDGAALVLHGNVDIREVELAFRQGGRIAKLLVDEGAAVRAGQLLAVLDAKPFEDAAAAAQARLAQSRAELDKLRRGNRRQDIAQAQATVAQAQAAADDAQRALEREQALLASGAISERAVEQARSVRDQTAAQLAAARQGLSLRQEGSRREDIAAGEALVAAAEAAVAQAQTALADAQLLAPSAAVVSTRLREVGSMVGAGTTVLTLSLQDPMYVRAYASPAQLTRLAPGTAVQVRIDGHAQPLAGTVGFISPRAEFTPKSVETTELRTDLVYRLRIVVPGGASVLRQGMPVTVQLAGSAARS